MAVNKVEYNENGQLKTLIDLTADTVTADKLAKGYTAHDMSGNIITGTMESGNKQYYLWNNSDFGVYMSNYNTLIGYSSYTIQDYNGVLDPDNPKTYTGYISTATSRNVGENISNYVNKVVNYTEIGPYQTSSTVTNMVITHYNSCTLTAGTYSRKNVTVVNYEGTILYVGTWVQVAEALNNKSIVLTNGIRIVGNYAYLGGSDSHSLTKLVFK